MHPEQQLSIARNSEGATSMAVISSVGAALQKLSLDGVTVIDSDLVSNPAGMFFGCALAPWPNRLANHTYAYSGKLYQTPNVDSDGNSNHGLIFDRALEITNLTEDAVTLGYHFGADSSYPFDIDLAISYQLIDSGLKVSATAVNYGASAPFGIGFHPYFSVGEDFTASANFTKKIIVSEKMIPVSEKRIEGLIYQGGQMDDCFAGTQLVTLETKGYGLSVTLDKGYEYFMLYRPSLDCGDSLLSIEPMSCLTNAFNSDLNSVIIEAGETKEFSFSIKKN